MGHAYSVNPATARDTIKLPYERRLAKKAERMC